uniref:Magnesium-dependent phosphatase-1 n=1 Tax=Rhizochromulina marina TaxID=1034831 RepID=A0A7S2W301_9STRA
MAEVSADAALVAAIVDSGVDMFAFDWDMTITSVHCYNSRVQPEDVPGRWTSDIPDAEDFASVLNAIQAAGRHWCIVTFGQKDVVQAYLQQLGFEEDHCLICSPLGPGERYSQAKAPPKDKNDMLVDVVRLKGLPALDRLVLFDDDGRNVMAAQGAGFRAVTVDPGRGMSAPLFLEYLQRG